MGLMLFDAVELDSISSRSSLSFGLLIYLLAWGDGIVRTGTLAN
jgi:hypothetical protein